MENVFDSPGSLPVIEQATWRDLNSLRQIERICFPKDAWPLWDLIGVLTLPNVVRLKAIVDGEMVGFISGEIHPGDGMAWIATVGVLPEFRRRGIGQALISQCEELLRKQSHQDRIRLSVRLSNQEAIQLYLHLGYQKIDIWPQYYIDREDALVMEKTLL